MTIRSSADGERLLAYGSSIWCPKSDASQGQLPESFTPVTFPECRRNDVEDTVKLTDNAGELHNDLSFGWRKCEFREALRVASALEKSVGSVEGLVHINAHIDKVRACEALGIIESNAKMREAYQMLESMTEHREKAFAGEGLSELQRRPSTLETSVKVSFQVAFGTRPSNPQPRKSQYYNPFSPHRRRQALSMGVHLELITMLANWTLAMD
ncbi:MAG: hypothetical protein FRX48_09655 [Lasallia pustulata]|uniref:Uncharacterized protein n=1 Tax=Lasallia pustulata TaxID=136370 RepID=A0A5M8PCD1_9LECA|nr:MAG: hypothetical protein FRX48_09655 [Lasallia pustulata]